MAQTEVYMDYAAATPMADDVLTAMQPYFSEVFYNPSATYLAAKKSRDALNVARQQVAKVLGVRPVEVTFTAGGSEANNLAIHGVMRRYPDKNLVVSAVEHESVLAPAQLYDSKPAPVTPNGLIDLQKLEALIDDNTVLVSVMYANNEIGTVQPLRKIANLLDTIRADRRQKDNQTPLLFHTDAAQAANYLDLHVARLGVDLLTLNGGKIYGPKQSGALFIKAGLKLEPLVYGGGQEHGLRSGTENVAAAVGFAAALESTQVMRQDETKRLQTLQRQFFADVAARLSTVEVNGTKDTRLPNNIHLTFPGQDNERLLLQLEQVNILAAAGSACSASSDEPSHVLKAIGLDDVAARSSLRFTMGRPTSKEAVSMVVDALVQLLA
ncbi:cysteine desulfurase [Candidatus Saccharibacteria bacterium]|nr:cysteine desulfurase [Candidatus Saccharibacteria bacterium]